MRPPVAPEEQQDRQGDGDDDPLQDAEQHHAGRCDQGHRERAPAHPQVAAQDAQVHQRQRGDDHDRGQRRLREVGEQRVEKQQQHHDQACTHDAGDLALGSRLFGHGGA